MLGTMHEHAHHTGHLAHASVLDLDAEVFGPQLEDVLVWGTAGLSPRTVADLGAGTGTGTRALVRRFPDAEIVAVDNSEDLLAHLRASYDGARVRTVLADLDAAWPDAVADVDLIWTASALHHLGEPARVLAEAHAALAPGGVLVAVEIAELPQFLPVGYGEGLEGRLQEAMAASGWNHHPDWRPHLEAVGFTVEHRQVGGAVEPLPSATATYAQAWLSRVRHGLAEALTPADRDRLDVLLGDGPEGLRHRDDLVARGARSAWLARV
jgi:SAM-dependent methyltransferase